MGDKNMKMKMKTLTTELYSPELFYNICQQSEQFIDLHGSIMIDHQLENVFNVLKGHRRLQFTSTQQPILPVTITLEENLFSSYRIELASAALQAFAYFFTIRKIIQKPKKGSH